MASWRSRIGPRSPAACRKAAGTSLVADIARNCITSPGGSRQTVDEVVDEAVARSPESRAELSFDERVVARQVETTVEDGARDRSEEHTSELQSHSHLVCRLLLEK